MLTALDVEVDLAPVLKVEVPEVWLRADDRMRELAYRIDSPRTRRRIAERLERESVALEGMEGLELSGRIRPHGEGESLTVELTSANPSLECEDVFTFELVHNPETLGYDVTDRAKLVREVWGGGCVPPGLCVELLAAVASCEGVSRAAARFGEVVAPEDVAWDWIPAWFFSSVALPGTLSGARGAGRKRSGTSGRLSAALAKGAGGEQSGGQATLQDLASKKLSGRGSPGFLVLATWSLAVEERPASSGGVRVHMALDPEGRSLVGSWEEEWRALY
jgi:hypothetical protein